MRNIRYNRSNDNWSAVWLDKHALPGFLPPAIVAHRQNCNWVDGTTDDVQHAPAFLREAALGSEIDPVWEIKDLVKYIVTQFATQSNNKCKQIMKEVNEKRQLLYKNHIS